MAYNPHSFFTEEEREGSNYHSKRMLPPEKRISQMKDGEITIPDFLKVGPEGQEYIDLTIAYE